MLVKQGQPIGPMQGLPATPMMHDVPSSRTLKLLVEGQGALKFEPADSVFPVCTCSAVTKAGQCQSKELSSYPSSLQGV